MLEPGDQSPKTENQTSITAVILSAGRSQRMGAFKPLLKFGNSTVIEHAIQTFRQAGINSIVVVAGHRSEELKQHLHDPSLTFVLNPDAAAEMSTSIVLAIKALPPECEAVAITPVDHAAVPASVVSKLVRSWQSGARLVVPDYKGRGGHPVLIDRSYDDELLNLTNEVSGLRGFLKRHEAAVVRVQVDSPYIARDMDTWDDYVAIHRELFGQSPAEQRSAENH